MADLKVLNTELATLANQAKALYAEIEAKGEKATADDRTKLDNLIAAGDAKRAERDRLVKLTAMTEGIGDPEGEQKAKEPPAAQPGQAGGQQKSWGQAVFESQQLKDAAPRWQEGKMDRVQVGAGISLMKMLRKALYGSTDAAGGVLVVPQREVDVLDIARKRALTILDLIGHSPTNSDAVEYVIQDTRTNAAAIWTDYTGSGTTLKPESTFTFDIKTALVKTIPTWIAVARQLLADAPRLRATIDDELTYMVELTLETQVLADVLAWSGIQSRVHKVSGRDFDADDYLADTIRRSITDVRLEFYEPDGVVLNPAEGEKLELEKASDGHYVQVFDPVQQKVWRVRVVETPAITAGTGLTGAWRLGAKNWDREQTQILVGQPGNMFLQNAVALLAELRAAWAVTRPKAFEKITGM